MDSERKEKDKHIGICRLCKQEKKLTFEHIPPKSVFNNSPVYRYDGNEVLNNPDSFEKRVCFTKMRRGSGKFCLCKDCNSFTGGKYNKTYELVAKEIGNRVLENTGEQTTGFNLLSSDIAWGSFFRQAMVMFVDVCDMCSDDDALRYYLLHPEYNQFNSQKYRLLIFVTKYPHKNITKIIGNIPIDSCNLRAAEITAFPVGMLLLIDENSSIEAKLHKKDFSSLGVDITAFSMYTYNDKVPIEMTIPIHCIVDANSILEILNCTKDRIP